MADLYGLIDTARDERLYDLVVAEPEHACLFEGKLDADLARAAPYIVRLREGSRLLQAWETKGRGQSWGIQCTSDRSLTELRRHFRHFLRAKLPNGELILFRFYDPRVFGAYLPTCPPDELSRWFEQVPEYHFEDGDRVTCLQLRGAALDDSREITYSRS